MSEIHGAACSYKGKPSKLGVIGTGKAGNGVKLAQDLNAGRKVTSDMSRVNPKHIKGSDR